MRYFVSFLIFFLLFAPNIFAQQSQEAIETQLRELKSVVENLQKTTQEQNKRIEELEKQNGQLRQKLESPQAQLVPPPAATIPQSPIAAGLQAFNPEIGVVGDIVATSSESRGDSEGNDRIALRELELVLGHYVDPYSRFDATISFSDSENPNVEEAHLSHWGLPWDIKGSLGRFRPKIGKACAIHRDSLDTVDEPFVVARYFGAEGFSRTGFELHRLFEAPFGLDSELTFGLLEGGVGEGGTAFGSSRRHPTVFSHLKLYKDITDVSSFELGLTHLAGSKDNDPKMEANVLGFDAVYLRNFSAWNRLKLQSELYFQDRDESFSAQDDGTITKFRDNPFGFYTLADLRLNQRWASGLRFDYVELVDNPLVNKREMDLGYSAYLTLHQSEWARWRLQYRHTDYATGKNDDAVMFQGTFAIGVHKHKLQ
ncbi:MAG: hypothetical protein Q7J72_06195 [Candidatus Omnitrophota bacterium]|nr:hypothetical protein [Candidatus Omnitrophota bacterium]